MKIGVVLLGALISAVVALPTPHTVPPQCVDPTFACQDLEHARSCEVVKSCIHDIWATMNAPDDNDEICDLCKEMVKEARDQLLSNMTQEEIKQVFEGSCKLLPVKLIADGCIEIVDEIIPELVEMLASRMDPNMVCTVSGLCNLAHLPIRSKIVKVINVFGRKSNGDECSDCTTMVNDVKTFLKDTPESEVKTYVEKICDKEAPSYLCNLVVGQYLPEAYNYITSTDAKQVCSDSGICPQTCQPGEEPKKVQDELVCEFCTNVLEHIKEEIIANTTVEEFRTALLNFCKVLGTYSTECTSLVNDYYDMVFDYIRKLDTKSFCTLIGLCTNMKCSNMIPLVRVIPPLETRNRMPLIKIEPATPVARDSDLHPIVKVVPEIVPLRKQPQESNYIFDKAVVPALPVERFSHPIINFERDTECAFCRAISFYLQQDLKNFHTRSDVHTAVKNVCDKWVKEFPEECQNFIHKYSNKVELAISDNIKFEELCQHINVCQLEDKNSELKVKVLPKLQDKPFCDMCKEALTEVENELKKPETKQQVKSFLARYCAVLPGELHDACIQYLDDGIDTLFTIIEQELVPDNVCPALGLCAALPRAVVPKIVKDMECDLCKDVVTTFREKLKDPAVKQTVVTLLDDACARLPGDLATECKDFVTNNIDTVIAMVIQEMDPDTVCSILKICQASVNRVIVHKANDIECDLCKELVGEVEELVKNQKTQDDIKTALKQICSYLPSSMVKECDDFVDQYTSMIINLLATELDPTMVCQELNICPNAVKEVKLQNVKDMECDVCKMAMGELEDLIKDKKTEIEIKAALEEVCSFLPTSWKAKCDTFIETYLQTIITLIVDEVDPSMICGALGVCPTQDLECQSCQYALHFIEEQLANPDSQAQLKELIKKLCDVLPGQFSKNCDAFVDEYGSAFLMLLAQEIDPNVLCYDVLDMCSNQTKLFSKLTNKHSFSTDTCNVCTTVVDYIDKLLEDDSFDKEITQLAEKVCNVVPESSRTTCETIIEAYGPYILQMIGQVTTSKEVCQEIDLCSRPPGHVHLVGGHKCTFGPSYWCQSNAHAAACKAENFCKVKVWKQ